MSMLEKDQQFVWHPFTQAQIAPLPIPTVKAEGAWLFDEDGKKYLDANSSWWTILHGHCNPYIIEKIQGQLKQLDHTVFAGATHTGAIEIAERIVTNIPGAFAKAFFSDNGSTSVEVAIKMVYQFWHNQGISKKKILAIEGAYHGDTFGAMSVGGRGGFNKPFEHLLFDVDYLPFPTKENYSEVIQKASDLMANEEYAGFIFEPLVQGASGMRMYEAELLDQLIKLAKENGIIIIADEVMTGFYRTGTLFAIHQLQETVDIVCLSKGLTGGLMAMGLTVTTQKIYDAFLSDEIATAFLHGHSFTGNPIACSAACASLDLLLNQESITKVETIVKRHKQFQEKIKDHPSIREVRVKGTIIAIEVEVGEESSYFSNIRTEAYEYFLENELLIRPLGNVIFLNPPYCITEEELEYTYDHVLKFIDSRE